MGLCKCERKRVTNMFCFEHRVNVCDFCLVSNHSKCIVKSYLRWLTDSEFDPTCYICQERFDSSSKKCVRLVCLDVFHWDCLNDLVSQLPPTTTPAGYTCPLCSQPIVPQPNHGGPIAEALRMYLKDASWAQNGIDDLQSFRLPNTAVNHISGHANRSTVIPTQSISEGKLLDPQLDAAAKQFIQGQDVTKLLKSSQSEVLSNSNCQSNHGYEPLPQSHCQRRDQLTSTNHLGGRHEEDDKYKRRPAFALLKRFISARFPTVWRGSALRKRRLMLLVIFVIFCIFLLGFYQFEPSDFTDEEYQEQVAHPKIRLDQESIDMINRAVDRNLESNIKEV